MVRQLFREINTSTVMIQKCGAGSVLLLIGS